MSADKGIKLEQTSKAINNFITQLKLKPEQDFKKVILEIESFNTELIELNKTITNLKATREQWLNELLTTIDKIQREAFLKEMEDAINNLFDSVCDSAIKLIKTDAQSLSSDHARQIQQSFHLVTDVLQATKELCHATSIDNFISAVKHLDKAHDEIFDYQRSKKLFPHVAKALGIVTSAIGILMPFVLCFTGLALCSNPITLPIGTGLLLAGVISIFPGAFMAVFGIKGYQKADRMGESKNPLSFDIRLNKPSNLIDKAQALLKNPSQPSKANSSGFFDQPKMAEESIQTIDNKKSQ